MPCAGSFATLPRMKNILFALLCLLPLATFAQSQPNATALPAVAPVSASGPQYTRAVFVYHPETGTVVQSENADMRMGPASLTKMMTLYLAFEALKEGKLTTGTMVPVSEKAWRTGGSKMFIEVGKQIPVEDLIRGIAIVSGNDACVAIAEQLGGTEEGFAGLMNAKAKDLGMAGTNFANSNGLPDPNQYTTAHDMARLLTAIFRDFPEYKHYMAEQEFTFNNIKQQNRNRLLGLNMGIDASKTGHTEESGYHLASTAVQNGERLVVVVMGTAGFNEREGATLQAFRTTFSTYGRRTLVAPGAKVVEGVPVWHGAVGNVALTVAEPATLYANRANPPQVKTEATFNTPLVAPLNTQQAVGELKVTLADGTVKTYPLVPAQTVEKGGFMGNWFQSLGHLLGLGA